MSDAAASTAPPAASASPVALGTDRGRPLRAGGFRTLVDALDHAATTATGMNFHDRRGQLQRALPYAELAAAAVAQARTLCGLGARPGDRVALLAETSAEFVIAFFACHHAALVPVPVPVMVQLGGHVEYTEHLRRLLDRSRAVLCLYGDEFAELAREATRGQPLHFAGTWRELAARPESAVPLRAARADDAAYVQFTSGSTRFPRGAVLQHAAVNANLDAIIRDGIELRDDDRILSWLPLYHDMGLVGKMLVPVAGQVTVDYLDSRAFAMRPRLWPELMTRTAASISFGPPFGYDLCARRVRDGEGARFDLARWRIAGVGAELIRPDVLERFAVALADGGFDRRAFAPCYGMAEVGLAVTFSPLARGFRCDRVDAAALETAGLATPVAADAAAAASRAYVDCGVPLPGYTVEVRDGAGLPLGDGVLGGIHVRCASLMSGYLDEPDATAAVVHAGWLDTGDIGYWRAGHLFVTGRRKDLIIVNGRNIAPQDLEAIAEAHADVRSGDALAFSHSPDDHSTEEVVVMIQCRVTDEAGRKALQQDLRGAIRRELGIDCVIELVAPHSLPKTSSGKPSRAQARRAWLAAGGRAT